MQGGSEEARIWFSVWVLFFREAIGCRGSCPCAVTVYKRGEQSAVDISGDGNVICFGKEVANRFLALPITFDLVSVFVESAASIAVGKYIGIITLDPGRNINE